MRFDYLAPSQDAVFDGLDEFEKIYALEQAEYKPIRTLPAQDGESAIYRCTLTDEQRRMVADGADVLIEILHFGGPLAPSRVMLLNDRNIDTESGESIEIFRRWFAVQTSGPYSSTLERRAREEQP